MRWLIALCLAGCGRIAFDPLDVNGARDAGDGDTASTDDARMLPAGLIAWWKLDENTGIAAADSIGSANGMLMAGGGAPPVWGSGQTGSAVVFAGTGDRVAIGTPAALANLPALTISAWVKPTNVTAGGNLGCVFDKSNGIDTGWFLMVGDASDGDVSITVYFGTTPVRHFSTGGSIAVNQWTHIVATWDGSNNGTNIRLYANGGELAYGAFTMAASGRTNDAAIATAINCVAVTGMPGTIDDVMIWNRVLVPAEVAGL